HPTPPSVDRRCLLPYPQSRPQPHRHLRRRRRPHRLPESTCPLSTTLRLPALPLLPDVQPLSFTAATAISSPTLDVHGRLAAGLRPSLPPPPSVRRPPLARSIQESGYPERRLLAQLRTLH